MSHPIYRPASVFLATVGALLCAGVSPARAGVFNVNLLENPGAEAGNGAANETDVFAPPSWLATGNVTAVQYDTASFPSKDDFGPPAAERGKNLFAGGPGSAHSSLFQAIDVSAGAADIDAGGLPFMLQGWFGGYSALGDSVSMTVEFVDKDLNPISDVTIGPVTDLDRGQQTGLKFVMAMCDVPMGTRDLWVTVDFVRDGNYSYNHGFADNLSVEITKAVPEPSALTLSGLGALGLLGSAWRRRARR